MLRTPRPLVGVALVVAVVMGACPAARAQLRGSFRPQLNPFLANPNFFVAPGLTLNQAAFNIRVLGSAYRSVPPYALGYNPYIHSVNYGTMSPYMMPYSSYGSPMYSMPYSYGMSSGYGAMSYGGGYGGGSYGGGYGAAPMANYDASSSGAGSSPYALRTSAGYGQGQGAGGPLAGLLNDEGKLDWPLALRILPPGPQVSQLRQQIDARAGELQREAATGQTNPGLARELSHDVDTLRSLLADRAESLPVSQQALTEARRFLHKLQDTLQTVR
jgi:hypothetical protein